MQSVNHDLMSYGSNQDYVSTERVMQSLDAINDAFLSRRDDLIALAGRQVVDEAALVLKWLTQKVEADAQLSV